MEDHAPTTDDASRAGSRTDLGDLDAIEILLADVCFGKRWVAVLALTDEIRKWRLAEEVRQRRIAILSGQTIRIVSPG